MPRLIKFAIAGFLGYAVVTATPAQQTQILEGALAIKDAALEACQREGSLCAAALEKLTATVSGSLHDSETPWFDDAAKRTPPPAPPKT